MDKVIYLDNNATTFMSKQTIATMNKWVNQGNPSSGYLSAQKQRMVISAFKNTIAADCGFINAEECKGANENAFRIIFTSCASESNVTICNMVIRSWKKHRHTVPHIITSAYEHKSILELLHQLQDDGDIELTELNPAQCMRITPADLRAAIRQNTALITIMHANNELGVINDIYALSICAHAAGVPFHTDTVQTFGKYKIPLSIDACSVSFHKLFGPTSIGVLILREEFLRGYNLKAMITGSQNAGFRGGTENVSLIAAALSGYKEIIIDRPVGNKAVADLKSYIIKTLSDNFYTISYDQYEYCQRKCFIVLLSGNNENYLHNTLLISIVRKIPPLICNIKLRTTLEERNIIVGIGSACNTSSSKASHVLYAIGADKFIRAGTLRISLSYLNKRKEVEQFLYTFIRILRANLTPDCAVSTVNQSVD